MRILVFIVIAIVAVWILSMLLSAAMAGNTTAGTAVKSKRQLRIEKHSWDRDEYWVGVALVALIVVKLFWK